MDIHETANEPFCQKFLKMMRWVSESFSFCFGQPLLLAAIIHFRNQISSVLEKKKVPPPVYNTFWPWDTGLEAVEGCPCRLGSKRLFSTAHATAAFQLDLSKAYYYSSPSTCLVWSSTTLGDPLHHTKAEMVDWGERWLSTSSLPVLHLCWAPVCPFAYIIVTTRWLSSLFLSDSI